MSVLIERLESGLAALDIAADEKALERFERYYTLLEERNEVMNLTAIEGEEQTAQLHFLDSAAVLKAADFQNRSLIDVGTGAGFPGIPMKILEPSLALTLFDSLGKRVAFLEELVGELGLTGVRCVHGRAEEAAQLPELREAFDFATARAVSRLDMLTELCLPFVKPGGQFLAMKAADSEQERLAAIPVSEMLGGRYLDFYAYTIPGTQVPRLVYRFEKREPTAKQYPRRYSKLKKLYA